MDEMTPPHDDPEVRHDESGDDEAQQDLDHAAPDILSVARYGPRPLV